MKNLSLDDMNTILFLMIKDKSGVIKLSDIQWSNFRWMDSWSYGHMLYNVTPYKISRETCIFLMLWLDDS